MFERANIRFTGNQAACAKWLPYGRKLLTDLLALGLSYNRKTYVLSSTVEIEVEVAGPARRIAIKVTGGCPTYLSGLIDVGAHATRPVNVNGVTVSEEGAYRFYPSAHQAGDSPRDWQVPAELTIDVDPAFRWADFTFSQTTPEGWFLDGTTQLLYIKPGMYSGKMRTVVQYLLGANIRVKYDYRNTRTHGIFSSPQTGSPWLIEISQANGVLARPLPKCSVTGITVSNALGYIPLGASFPSAVNLEAAIASGQIRRLLQPVDLSGYYSKTPHFSECGWAFSTSGHEAQNCVTDFIDPYVHGYRYKIAISANETGPVSATLSLVESGILALSALGLEFTSCMKVPNYFALGVRAVIWEPNIVGYDLTMSPSCNTPIHVWYDGDAEQVARYVTEPAVIHQDTDYGTPLAGFGNPDAMSPYSSDYGPKWPAIASTWLDFTCQTFSTPASNPSNRFSTTTGTRTLQWQKAPFSMQVLSIGLFGSTVQTRGFAWSYHETMPANSYKHNYDVLVVPLFEREAVYHFQRLELRANDGYSWTRTPGVYTLSPVYAYRNLRFPQVVTDPEKTCEIEIELSGPGSTAVPPKDLFAGLYGDGTSYYPPTLMAPFHDIPVSYPPPGYYYEKTADDGNNCIFQQKDVGNKLTYAFSRRVSGCNHVTTTSEDDVQTTLTDCTQAYFSDITSAVVCVGSNGLHESYVAENDFAWMSLTASYLFALNRDAAHNAGGFIQKNLNSLDFINTLTGGYPSPVLSYQANFVGDT